MLKFQVTETELRQIREQVSRVVFQRAVLKLTVLLLGVIFGSLSLFSVFCILLAVVGAAGVMNLTPLPFVMVFVHPGAPLFWVATAACSLTLTAIMARLDRGFNA